jgi:hypothetical protein
MAKSQAQKDSEAAQAAQAEAQSLLGENLEIQTTGVALDTTDPNYEQLKRLEDLRNQVAVAQQEAVVSGQDAAADVYKASLDAEEARLRAELAAAQQAATSESAAAGVAGVLDNLQAQAEAAKTAEAAASGNNTSGS